MISLLLLLGMGATAFAPAASAAPVYSPPSGAWARFASDLDAAQGLANGSGVTIALVSTGVDPAVIGGGKVTTGPNYIFKPQAAESLMLGTQFAAFLVGAHGQSAGIAPGARILSLRTEPDSTEPGARAFFTNGSDLDEQALEAKAIRYAAGHGAQVILTDFGSANQPTTDLLSAVSYAVSRNVVIVTGAFPVSGASSQYLYPEGLPGVIGVVPVTLPGGTPPQATLGGQHNNSVLISAPANEVPASQNFTLLNFGTAMGFVTGTVALIKQRYPHISPALVARALAMSARYHPRGGYSTSAGFGVLDPYNAILDAGKLTSLAGTAPAGGSRAVTAGGHFGKPPGVTSALPPIGRAAYLYWGLIALGGVLLLSDLALVVRRRRRRSRARRGGAPQFVPQAPVPHAPGPQYAAQAQVAQQYGGRQYAGQPYAGQQDPWQQDPWQQVGSRYLESTQSAAQYPAAQYPAAPNPAAPNPAAPNPAAPYQERPSFSPRPAPPPTRPQPVLPETPPDKPPEPKRGWFDPR